MPRTYQWSSLCVFKTKENLYPLPNQRLYRMITMMPNKSLSLLTQLTSHIVCNISNFNNGHISHLNIDIVGMEETYSNEKQIIVPCKHGFTGFFKIRCSGGVWTKVLGDKCTCKFIFVFVVHIFTMLHFHK